MPRLKLHNPPYPCKPINGLKISHAIKSKNVKLLTFFFLFVFQDAAEKEDKPSILKETIHNLALSEDTGSLWYIDNESSFLDAYSLLYDDENTNGVRFKKFHKEMLKSSCVFRKKTINRLFAMKKSLDPAQLLLEFVNVNEPLFQNLPQIHSNSIFRQHFSQRIQEVWNWVQECQLRVNYRPLK